MYDDEEPIPPELAVEDAPFSDSELEEALDDEIAGPEAVPRRWRPSDDDDAEWVARKLAEAMRERHGYVERAAVWAKRISEWLENRTRRLDQRVTHFSMLLQAYALERRDKTNEPTLVLPSAKVTTHKKGAKVVVAKSDEFLGWAKTTAPSLLRYPEPEPVAAEIKKRVAMERVTVGWEVTITLSCGHVRPTWLHPEEHPSTTAVAPELMDTWMECTECAYDPIDGHPSRQVTEVVVAAAREVMPVFDGKPVPGLSINPEAIEVGKVEVL